MRGWKNATPTHGIGSTRKKFKYKRAAGPVKPAPTTKMDSGKEGKNMITAKNLLNTYKTWTARKQSEFYLGLSHGNLKLKENKRVGFLVWNIPAVITCPFRTDHCTECCYALKAEIQHTNTCKPARARHFVMDHFKDNDNIVFVAYTKSVKYFDGVKIPDNMRLLASVWDDTTAENLEIIKRNNFRIYTAYAGELLENALKSGFSFCPCKDCGSCGKCWNNYINNVACQIH